MKRSRKICMEIKLIFHRRKQDILPQSYCWILSQKKWPNTDKSNVAKYFQVVFMTIYRINNSTFFDKLKQAQNLQYTFWLLKNYDYQQKTEHYSTNCNKKKNKFTWTIIGFRKRKYASVSFLNGFPFVPKSILKRTAYKRSHKSITRKKT